jgi:phage terminase large subunit
MIIRSLYRPRGYFRDFHLRKHRWAVLVAHRRAGKTVSVVNDIIEKASYNTRENPRYAYVAPLLRQAKDIAWQYVKDYAAPFSPKVNESGLYVELSSLPNKPRITLYGADNPDSFRGMYFDGVALDEFGNMRGSVFQEILLPALIDRRGWAVFMGTPNGPNHFRDMYYDSLKDDSWFVNFLPYTKTNILSEEDIAMMRKMMDEEQFAQEMECSFEASVRGAIYARQMENVEKEERIGDYPLSTAQPVHLAMDLGHSDDTTMGFFQTRFDGNLMGHAHHDNMKPIKHYIKYLQDFCGDNKLKLGTVWLPHDAKAKTLQTGRAIIDHFRDANIRPKLVPRLDVIDGIAATRTGFPSWYFHRSETEKLVLALKSYHRKYDEEKKIFTDEPVHDWSSHYADMFRYANIVTGPKQIPDVTRPAQQGIVKSAARVVNYGFSLDDLWSTAPSGSRRTYG